MRWLIAIGLGCVTLLTCRGQDPGAAEPTVGLRDVRPQQFALTEARVVTQPGQVLEEATILVRGTSIEAVGRDLDVPPGWNTIECRGKTIYAGLIDAWSEADVEAPRTSAGYWNSHVTPERSAEKIAAEGVGDASKLRSQGITIRLVAPRGGIVKGNSSLVLLGTADGGRRLLKEHVWHHLQLTVPRGRSGSTYPNSPMGAVALLRQSLYDASWYREAWNTYQSDTSLSRPETNQSLATLATAIENDAFVIDAPNERMALRADQIAREFSLQMIIRGSGREYRQLAEIARCDRPILLPVDFPEPPSVKTSRAAQGVTLQELMHWDLAPENPGRLVEAGVSICLTTDGLGDVGDYLKQVRTAVEKGLSPDDALAAMTTAPARLMQVDHIAGTIQPGKLANLVVADGDLFADQTKIKETWVAGERYLVEKPKLRGDERLLGNWRVQLCAGSNRYDWQLKWERDGEQVSGRLLDPKSDSSEEVATADSESKESEEGAAPSIKLTDVVWQRDRLTASAELSKLDSSAAEGVSRIKILSLPGDGGGSPIGSIELPDGTTVELELVRQRDPDPKPEKTKVTETDNKSGGEPDAGESPADQGAAVATDTRTDTPVLHPLGAYGIADPGPAVEHVMFRGAKVWTCDEPAIIDSGDVIIKDGRVVAVGDHLDVPEGCRVIDVRGKHITPGLIDCHSHMGTDGGVNESGQAVTAEVRIGDFIDNSDITIYRQLAGGLTTSNILHGSANPIGGQNQVIKLRWGDTMEGLRMIEAPPGIKFALGENVKRNQSRYPNTRMGVEQIIRDQLLTAREYDARWRRWRAGERDGLPPRTDLQLKAMAEVQRGERWIHCHSYRQDEIVATLDLLEEFGVRIGTLQHILEGYKVADRMARHGAMASAFSDWWAYKFEVYDAIPYNGAVMHDRGIVVSFNSDDRELGRRMNTEAAKATKYGGVSEEEALKFVTLNPAKQLRIDRWVGSLVSGKHADLVVWSGPPLSTMTRCEQTWIDGRKYFDVDSSAAVRDRDAKLRTRLIQKVLRGGKAKRGGDEAEEVAEEDRWLRYDEFCRASGRREP